MNLAAALQKIYDSEINLRISWIWDAGLEVRLGDESNGFLAEENVSCTADVLPWLQEAIAHFYPESTYARLLPDAVRERAKVRLFRPPAVGAQVRCLDCGAPHATPAGMTELIALTCHHCGAAVKVDPRKCNKVRPASALPRL